MCLVACGQVVQGSPSAGPPTVSRRTYRPSAAPPTFTPPPSGDRPLPALLAEIQGPAGGSIADMFLDREANRLYVLDGSAQLHVLAADTFQNLATLRLDPQIVQPRLLDSYSRHFTLDRAHDRLYLPVGDIAVLVVDTASLTAPNLLTPGGPLALDGTVTAYSARAMFRSTDWGQSWVLVAEGDVQVPRGGEASCLDPERQGNCIRLYFSQNVFEAPAGADPSASYALSPCNVYRSRDEGHTWQRWRDDRLAPFHCSSTLDRMITAGAISPLMPDGGYQLFVGTGSGQFWVLDPAEMDWIPVQ
jgi:hypothetical protein